MRIRLDWKLRRIASGYRQQDVAGRVGMSGTRYSALERGTAEPKEWEIEAIEKFLPLLSHTASALEPRRNSAVGEVEQAGTGQGNLRIRNTPLPRSQTE